MSKHIRVYLSQGEQTEEKSVEGMATSGFGEATSECHCIKRGREMDHDHTVESRGENQGALATVQGPPHGMGRRERSVTAEKDPASTC